MDIPKRMTSFSNQLKMATGVKRLSYTIEFKLKVVNFAKEHGNRAAARVFGEPPTAKMIREWRKQEQQLQTVKKGKSNLRCPAPHWPELEEELKEWVINERDLGKFISTKMIIQEARRLGELRGKTGFSGTEGWCYRFMKRHGLSMYTRKYNTQVNIFFFFRC